MTKQEQTEARLRLWQARCAKCESAYAGELVRMDEREALYRGEGDIRGIGGEHIPPLHTRNIIAENIEAQISGQIPRPRVQALHEEDEPLAALIEKLIACELDRLPMERLNDMDERTTPLQGGSGWLAEWDEGRGIALSLLHPQRILPQEGITEIEDMDYCILRIPQSRRTLEERYGVSLAGEASGGGDTAEEEMFTACIGYERCGETIDRFAWVGDTVLEDLEDYEAPRVRHCRSCGRDFYAGEACPCCGGNDWEEAAAENERLYTPVLTQRGTFIPVGDKPVVLPLYRPGLYPMLLRKNVSVFGKFLGDSDADKIRDQQNTISLMEQKILHRFCDAGTRITLPNDPEVTLDRRDQRVIHVKNAADVAAIKVVDFSGDLSQEMLYLSSVYQEARQAIGITNAYLGEADTTAASGKAKQFSASQAAGRLQSKRIMKQALYQELFERIFRLHLAYDTAPHRFRSQSGTWEEFDRYDFLRRSNDGSYTWNDAFLFSCDETDPPVNDRERRWQETTDLFRSGAFGTPEEDSVRLLFWRKMEQLHYPGAGETSREIEKRLRETALPSQETRKNPQTDGKEEPTWNRI